MNSFNLMQLAIVLCFALVIKIVLDINYFGKLRNKCEINIAEFTAFVCGGVFGEGLTIFTCYLAKERWKKAKAIFHNQVEINPCFPATVNSFRAASDKA